MLGRRFYTEVPPQARTPEEDKPTLLVSWWCTGFAATIILFRLAGRFIRVERLMREDKIMAIALIPLFARMALVHVVLIWGTNNTVTTGLTNEEIHHREMGSRLVLAARIMYAAILWTEKFSIAETLNRLVSHMPRLLYERIIVVLRWFLLVTFLGVVGSTLGECQPLTKAWQVIPDPGPQCRLAYAQLATMGTANVLTDLILVMLPIPIILSSIMTVRRKISLALLFALSLAPVATTLFRIPTLVDRGGSQQYRSLCASFEILIATAASNALALGSFVRDRGPKKMRFKFGSVSDTLSRPSTRRDGRITAMGDSDEDLVRSVGMFLDPEADRPAVKQAEVARVAHGASVTVVPCSRTRTKQLPPIPPPGHPGRGTPPDWPLPSPRMCGGAFAPITRDTFEPMPSRDTFEPPKKEVMEPSPPTTMTTIKPTESEKETQRNLSVSEVSSSSHGGGKVSFYDVGGLLEDGRSMTTTPIIDLYTSGPSTRCSTPKQFLPIRPAQPMTQCPQGTKVFLQDLGGLLSAQPNGHVRTPTTPTRDRPAMREVHNYNDPSPPTSTFTPASASRHPSPQPPPHHHHPEPPTNLKDELRTPEEEAEQYHEEDEEDEDDGPPYQPLSGNPVRPRRLNASEVSTNYSRAPLRGSQPLRDVGGLLSQDVQMVHPVR